MSHIRISEEALNGKLVIITEFDMTCTRLRPVSVPEHFMSRGIERNGSSPPGFRDPRTGQFLTDANEMRKYCWLLLEFIKRYEARVGKQCVVAALSWGDCGMNTDNLYKLARR